MQVQPAGFGTGLVFAQHAQTDALIELVVVQVSAVLDAQHSALAHHALHGALSVWCQNGLGSQGRIIGLVDHAVVALDGWPVALAGTAQGAPWHGSKGLGA